jgi:hypothetical protein
MTGQILPFPPTPPTPPAPSSVRRRRPTGRRRAVRAGGTPADTSVDAAVVTLPPRPGGATRAEELPPCA